MQEEKEFTVCNDCVNPDGCLSQCDIQEYIGENVAGHRSETTEQLWGQTQ